MKYSNFDLTLYNSYRIRSVADLALFPSSKDELIRYIDEYPNSVVIGGGNNIILLQQFYKYPFLFLRENLSDYQFEGDEKIIVSAGLSMSALSEIAADKSWIGFETFYDIPGSIGGGICMNAGAGDQFISDNLVEVEAFNLETKKLEIFSKSECKFGYRDSIFKNNKKLIIVSAVFLFNRAENDVVIRQRMREIKEKRFQKQPREFPNAGSVFKRPEGHYVGPMIQNLGLKGYSIGGAQISEKHAGFIINKGGATGADILALIAHIQQKVYDTFKINLEMEQIVI